MNLKTWQKNILSAIVIAGAGFILFNLAFVLAALVIKASISIMGLPENAAPPIEARIVFLIIVILISWLILKSKLNDLIKAGFLSMPLMVILIMIGISLYQQPMWMTGLIGAAIVGALIVYIKRKKLSWYYYFSTIFVAVLALCVMIFRIDI